MARVSLWDTRLESGHSEGARLELVEPPASSFLQPANEQRSTTRKPAVVGLELKAPQPLWDYRRLLPFAQHAGVGPLSAQQVVATITDRRSSKDKLLAALEHQLEFSLEPANALLDLVENTQDSEVRERAAKIYYLLYYSSGRNPDVAVHLSDSVRRQRFEYLLSQRQFPSVAIFLAQTAQLVLLPYAECGRATCGLEEKLTNDEKQRAENIAQQLVPLLYSALQSHLGDSDNVVRNELIVALENLSITNYVRSEKSARALRQWMDRETDPDLRARVKEHPILGKLLQP